MTIFREIFRTYYVDDPHEGKSAGGLSPSNPDIFK